MENQIQRNEFEKLARNVELIMNCLVGNELNDGKGLVKEVSNVSKRVDTIEDMFNKYRNIVIGLSIGSGAGMSAIIYRIVDAFTKH